MPLTVSSNSPRQNARAIDENLTTIYDDRADHYLQVDGKRLETMSFKQIRETSNAATKQTQ
eukprot:5998356-Lingulodinium_polyedra.AAC.1